MTDENSERALASAKQRGETRAVARLSRASNFLGGLVDAFKDLDITKQIGEAAHWAGAIGHALQEMAPPLKGLAALLKRVTQKNDPEEVGYLACSRAFESATAQTLRQLGRPEELKALTPAMRDGLDTLVPDADIVFSEFSFHRAESHPFVQGALRLLDGFAQSIGYTDAQRRQILARTASRFSTNLKSVLSHRSTEENFRPFTQRIGLGAEELTAISLLDEHAEFLRAQYEERQLFDHEPFALSDVYVEPQCSDLPWARLRDRRIDPLDTRDLERHELLERVMALIGDENYRDAIVIQGVAGAGKSAFTLRLCKELLEEGLWPVRIRLRDLQLDRHVQEALPAAVRYPNEKRPEGKAMRERTADLFRSGGVFDHATRFGKASIAPIVLILDGWDELSVTATVPFRERLERFLEQVRAEYLAEGRDPLIRVVLTGRPSLAFTDTRFLRDTTRILTLLPLLPDRVDRLLRSISAALSARRLAATSWDAWDLNEAQVDELSRRYEASFSQAMNSEQRHSAASAVEVLGLPLLAFITVRLVGEWRGDIGALIDSPTVLMRSLVDLTCLKPGQIATDPMELVDKARVSGHQLRQLLRHTAVAISVRGEETISFDELARRLKQAHLDHKVDGQIAQHPLAELLVSYFFKGGRRELGCEFVHKAFREYLFAEEIVEVLKQYGRDAVACPEPRQLYWKDFSTTDPRFSFSRRLTALVGRRWLAPEVVAHVLRLIEWELSRGDEAEPADAIHRVATESLDLEGWRRARNGLADLWQWWGEGIHLRPQHKDITAGTQIELGPLYAHNVIEESLDIPQFGIPPVAIPRVIAVDAQLGDALFRLAAFVHTRIAWKEGWADRTKSAVKFAHKSPSSAMLPISPDREKWPQEDWWTITTESGHPYQSHVRSALLFRPSGDNPLYFANYCARINGAGWRPEGRFPAGVDASGVDLMNVTIVSNPENRVSRTCWACANFQNVNLIGSFVGHDFNNILAINLVASATHLDVSQFTDALLLNAKFENTSLKGIEFEGTLLQNVKFTQVNLCGSTFHSATMINVEIEDVSMRGTSAVMAEFENVHFSRVDLTDSHFTSASFSNVSFRSVTLTDVDMQGLKGSPRILDPIEATNAEEGTPG